MPWMIGIFLGYILHKTRNKTIRIPSVSGSKVKNFEFGFDLSNFFLFVSKQMYKALGWIISMSFMITILFANHLMLPIQNFTTLFSFGLYESVSRVAWPIAISYIIFICLRNNGGLVNWFLSHPFWQPISNLSYAIYLVHYPIIIMFQAAMKSVQYFDGSLLVS